MKKTKGRRRFWVGSFLICMWLGLVIQMAVRAEENFAAPEILCPPADGDHGYYRTAPQIRIVHRDEKAELFYLLKAGGKNLAEGKLERKEGQKETGTVLAAGLLREGSNTLEIWLERAGQRIFYKKTEILLDTSPPENVQFTYESGQSGSELIFNRQCVLGIRSRDAVSGVKAIYYKMGGAQTKAAGGAEGQILIQPCFWGRVEAYAVDYAGNQSEWHPAREILCENLPPQIEIEINEAQGGQGRATVHVEVCDRSPSAGIKKMVCRTGGRIAVQKETPFGNAKKSEMSADLVVNGSTGGDITVEVWDHAGNYNIKTRPLPGNRQAGSGTQIWGGQWGKEEKETGEEGKRNKEEGEAKGEKAETGKEKTETGKEKTETGKEKAETGKEKTETGKEKAEAKKEEGETGKEKAEPGKEEEREAKNGQGPENSGEKSGEGDGRKLLRYAAQLEGSRIPYFEWNYTAPGQDGASAERLCTVLLDGKICQKGMRIEEEGRHTLRVCVTDARGKESRGEAVFFIDRTPPQIEVAGAEDGKVYTKEVPVSVSVSGADECLREICINGEKAELRAGAQVFYRELQETGDHRVEIVAEDAAGNRSKKQITFSIEAGAGSGRLRWLRRIFDKPVQQAFFLLCFLLAMIRVLQKRKQKIKNSTGNDVRRELQRD